MEGYGQVSERRGEQALQCRRWARQQEEQRAGLWERR